ncbi:ATP-binding cassette domain-containing protein [Pseudacidovorax intermedius]|uniref:ABC transporter ATP-binding protein n=1 Tax=Pseudacidovorax intermedius TaxID=433924 RepID=UPI0026EFB551|nr:ATP-binding cassette domain-containing protein [Pseudacidovorax intermedius]
MHSLAPTPWGSWPAPPYHVMQIEASAQRMQAIPPRLVVRHLQSPRSGPHALQLDGGECVAIRGRSGSGKSVLLRLIADLDPPTGGTVELDGQPREQFSGPQWRRRVIYQSAEPAWWAPTVGDHFDAAQRLRIAQMVEALGLPQTSLDAEVLRLSTGERQRLALLRSLAREPAVLLLDEPTAALDAESTQAYEDLLRRQCGQGLAILWVTHSDEQARRVATRSLVVDGGRLSAS